MTIDSRTPLILASRSPRRCELLATLGISFRVCAPDIHETTRADESPAASALRLSMEKLAAAQALSPPNTLILTADTVVALPCAAGWRQFGKPRDADEAYRMLRSLAEREHLVHTAFSLSDSERLRSQVVTSHVWLRALGETELRHYCASATPYDKAGGYAIQDRLLQPVTRIVGSYSNVMGLPLEALAMALRAFGLTIPFTSAAQNNPAAADITRSRA